MKLLFINSLVVQFSITWAKMKQFPNHESSCNAPWLSLFSSNSSFHLSDVFSNFICFSSLLNWRLFSSYYPIDAISHWAFFWWICHLLFLLVFLFAQRSSFSFITLHLALSLQFVEHDRLSIRSQMKLIAHVVNFTKTNPLHNDLLCL